MMILCPIWPSLLEKSSRFLALPCRETEVLGFSLSHPMMIVSLAIIIIIRSQWHSPELSTFFFPYHYPGPPSLPPGKVRQWEHKCHSDEGIQNPGSRLMMMMIETPKDTDSVNEWERPCISNWDHQHHHRTMNGGHPVSNIMMSPSFFLRTE